MNRVDAHTALRAAPPFAEPVAVAPGRLPVAVIGGGFSGTMVAIHLGAWLPEDRPILLCERGRPCRGAAYGTPNPGHMLNVRANNMSAFPHQPDHFDRWLDAVRASRPTEVLDTAAGRFASRGLYGRYLQSLLNRAIAGSAARVRLLAADVIDVVPDNGHYRLSCADGTSHAVAGVVLAVGNVPPASAESPLCRNNPWAAETLTGLAPDLPVLIVGTGLTMVDLVLELRHAGFGGPVIAVSRRGQLPHRHAATRRWPTPNLRLEERRSLARLVGRVRLEVRHAKELGVDWRGVIDSLRPITTDLWQGLPRAEQQRFLRHVRPYWDIHRHRLAAPVADQLAALLADGYLTVRRARVAGIAYGETVAEVTLRSSRGAASPERLRVQRVINATGLQNAAGADSPLIANLSRRGLVRLDKLAMGLEVTDALQVVAASGGVTPNLWALGPIVRGMFWECVAVPDIRGQAEKLSRQVCRVLDPGGGVRLLAANAT